MSDPSSRGPADAKVAVDRVSITPRQMLQLMSPEEWEQFTLEWMDGFTEPYVQKDKVGGAGDMGRDIVGFLGPVSSNPEWDNYQCKHYRSPLQPTNIYVELGKLCVYTHRKKYRIPRRYRFVSPFGVGPKLLNMLTTPSALRDALVENWDRYCKEAISDTERIPLEGELKAYVEKFDFSIVGYITVNELLEQHRRTRHWSLRFRLEPPVRPAVGAPPVEAQPEEAKYLTLLFAAYADHLKSLVTCVDDLASHGNVKAHYHRTREHFYSAEMLYRFSRDIFPGMFERVKDQIYSGVADITEADHPDGYRRVIATTQRSLDIPLAWTDLQPYLEPSDRQGICHHLAQDDRLHWTKSS